MDAFGSFKVNEKITLRGGIDNLLDKSPPRTGINPGVTEAAGVNTLQATTTCWGAGSSCRLS